MFLLLFHTFKLISRYFTFGAWFESACGCSYGQQIARSPEEGVALAGHPLFSAVGARPIAGGESAERRPGGKRHWLAPQHKSPASSEDASKLVLFSVPCYLSLASREETTLGWVAVSGADLPRCNVVVCHLGPIAALSKLK